MGNFLEECRITVHHVRTLFPTFMHHPPEARAIRASLTRIWAVRTTEAARGLYDTGPVRGCPACLFALDGRLRGCVPAWNVCRENAGSANGCCVLGKARRRVSRDSTQMIRQRVSGRTGKRNNVCTVNAKDRSDTADGTEVAAGVTEVVSYQR